ncbi:MAG: NUDIX domain-containing protein [Acidiferrobacterales bacterium]
MGPPLTPLLTTDVVIELMDRDPHPIVLIERRNPPYGWALPGGFVDRGESVESAAVREALEETGLAVRLTRLLGCYSDPARDPRGHTASIVYVAEARGEPMAQDDAAAFGLYLPPDFPPVLAFDHARILRDYLAYRQRGEIPGPRL